MSPSKIFYFLYFFFLITPSLYIFCFKHYENLWLDISFHQYDTAAQLFLVLTLLGFASFWLGSVLFKLVFATPKLLKSYKLFLAVDQDYYQSERERFQLASNKLINMLIVVSCFFIGLYTVGVGLDKILLLGSDLSAKEFRFSVTFSDGNAIYNNFLQIARRIFLPLIVVFLFFKSRLSVSPISLRRLAYYFIVGLFLYACLITLDRAPIIMFIVVFIYLWLLKVKFGMGFFVKIPVFLLLLLLAGGAMTFVQHNLIDSLSLESIFFNGINFLWHRVWAAPSIVGIELSIHLLPENADKLFLKYSRLGTLLGFERVGSQSDASVYVGPVSYIGDAWRNFGYSGVAIVSLYLGFLFSFFDVINRKIMIPYAAGLGILSITFVFYLSHGVFFSLGVFFQMIFMVFYSFYCFTYFKKGKAS